MVQIINNVKLPRVLYKYRDWSNNDHKKIITEQIIYFSSPSNYNDPFDCKIPERYDLISAEDFLADYNKHYPTVPEVKDKLKPLAEALLKRLKASSQNGFNVKMLDIYNELTLGIFCLTSKKDNLLMWGHYSANHTGFCVGLKTDYLLKLNQVDYIGKVKYRKKYPTVLPKFDIKERINRFYYKSSDWKYEAEYRMLTNNIKDRTIKLNDNAISEIILGCQVDWVRKDEILHNIRQFLPDTQVYKAKKCKNEFRLEFENIEIDKANELITE